MEEKKSFQHEKDKKLHSVKNDDICHQQPQHHFGDISKKENINLKGHVSLSAEKGADFQDYLTKQNQDKHWKPPHIVDADNCAQQQKTDKSEADFHINRPPLTKNDDIVGKFSSAYDKVIDQQKLTEMGAKHNSEMSLLHPEQDVARIDTNLQKHQSTKISDDVRMHDVNTHLNMPNYSDSHEKGKRMHVHTPLNHQTNNDTTRSKTDELDTAENENTTTTSSTFPTAS